MDYKDLKLSEDIKLRIRAMQFLASVCLFIMFVLNWHLNPDALEVQSRSNFLRELDIFTIAIVGLFIGMFVAFRITSPKGLP